MNPYQYYHAKEKYKNPTTDIFFSIVCFGIFTMIPIVGALGVYLNEILF